MVGARPPSVAEVNLDPDLAQGASFEKIAIPLADPVERKAGVLRPAALGAEQWPGDAVVASLSSISIAHAAHSVGRWGVLL